jgi:hypothetical protein
MKAEEGHLENKKYYCHILGLDGIINKDGRTGIYLQ